MKKLILIAALLFVGNHLVNAQISGVGFRPGLTLSKYKLTSDYNDIYDATLQPGGSFAGFLEINLGNRFTIQPELAFTQRGVHMVSESAIYWEGPEFGYEPYEKVVEYRFRETLNYIDIPVMVEKNFGGGMFGGYIAAGPALSFGIKGKGKEEILIEYPANEDKFVVENRTDRKEYEIEMGKGRYDMYKGFDFSLNLGAGLLFLLENGEIGLDLRYTHGTRGLDVNGQKNRNFNIGVSYMHYIGG